MAMHAPRPRTSSCPDISFLSTFPAEQEFLFLEPTGDVQKLCVDDATFTVIDVRLQQQPIDPGSYALREPKREPR